LSFPTRRSSDLVVVIDSGTPRNAPASAVHGLLGLEGTSPLQLLATGRGEAASYGAKIVHSIVADISGSAEEGFVVHLDNGTTHRAAQVMIATGVNDELPDIPGSVDCWRGDGVRCPYCHCREIGDRRLGLLA